MGYEGDYNLQKETEMYRVLHSIEEPNGLIFSASDKTQVSLTKDLLKDIETKDKKKKQ